MNLVQFLFAPANAPFAVAIGVMIALSLVEIVGVLTGAMSIEADVDGPETDAEAPGILNWLHFGSIPTLIFIILCSLGFGMTGYLAQSVALRATGSFLPWWAAAGMGLAGLALTTRGVGGILKRKLLRDESEAIGADDLIGKVAVITLGDAKTGQPSQAKLKDQFGTSHYILVEPLAQGSCYSNGQEVMLISRNGATYLVVGVTEDMDELQNRLEQTNLNRSAINDVVSVDKDQDRA